MKRQEVGKEKYADVVCSYLREVTDNWLVSGLNFCWPSPAQ
jgi:hypothetical protein